MTDDPTWTIAQMADDFEVTHRALRHYEHLGLLSPERDGQRRVYHRRERTRLALILRGRAETRHLRDEFERVRSALTAAKPPPTLEASSRTRQARRA